MKNYTLALLTLILFTMIGCKKESNSNQSNILRIEVSNVTTGNYSINLASKETGKTLFYVDYKTGNNIHETPVTPGQELTFSASTVGTCQIDLKYNNKKVGGFTSNNTGKSSTKSTIVIN